MFAILIKNNYYEKIKHEPVHGERKNTVNRKKLRLSSCFTSMRGLWLFFFVLGFGLSGCSPKIPCYHGGTVIRHVGDDHVNGESALWEYNHPELKFHSIIKRWLQGVDTTDKYLKDCHLPLKYRRLLFDNPSLQPELLYSAQSAKAWIAYNYFLLAMVYSSSDTIDVFQKKIEQSLTPIISTYSISESYLDNGKKVLCHKYSFLKNKHAAYHVASYYVQWNDAQIINVMVIDTDRGDLCYEVMFPIYGIVTNLFKEL
jgi:hypothetical protein